MLQKFLVQNYLVLLSVLPDYCIFLFMFKIETLRVASHSTKFSELQQQEYIEIWSASIHVNLYKNTIERHFPSEHHARAFDTLLSSSFTDCRAAFQKPFLPYIKAKMKQQKTWQVQCTHATSYFPERYKIILHEYQKFQLTAQLNTVIYLDWEC